MEQAATQTWNLALLFRPFENSLGVYLTFTIWGGRCGQARQHHHRRDRWVNSRATVIEVLCNPAAEGVVRCLVCPAPQCLVGRPARKSPVAWHRSALMSATKPHDPGGRYATGLKSTSMAPKSRHLKARFSRKFKSVLYVHHGVAGDPSRSVRAGTLKRLNRRTDSPRVPTVGVYAPAAVSLLNPTDATERCCSRLRQVTILAIHPSLRSRVSRCLPG